MGAEVRVGVVEAGSDDARLEELALLLRQELLALDVRAVEPYREGDVPDGTRGPGLAAIAGVLSVSLQPGLQVLGSVVSVVRDWLRRSGSGRTVKVTIDGDTIELSGANDAIQQQLVDAWVRKHTAA
ncbi:effector-associated constant component EACC1 [Kribbella sp. CA-247076]|uniref:effector-associated constant component EACC1 n=1 Tax=Kribbella sp. CA-247076 TaxID=3239941 RepID=UPI003D8CD40D